MLGQSNNRPYPYSKETKPYLRKQTMTRTGLQTATPGYSVLKLNILLPQAGRTVPPHDGGEGSSLLEQKAWFRPTSIEDLEKPHLL
ncbi:hypothetical protein ACFX1S_042526 [Malus domestica]